MNTSYFYAVLVVVLIAYLWVGWGDFDPRIPQVEVREYIRSSIRWTIQFLVQYIIPAAIIIYFGKEVHAKRTGCSVAMVQARRLPCDCCLGD